MLHLLDIASIMWSTAFPMPNYLSAREVREAFLKFFESKNHSRVASSGLIPLGDPTLFFTNAGMVQFKNLFLGEESRDYTRAVTSQKCLRVQGKHNDLEEVGRTPRHHTFFEMLGNFSFGDYFKEEAISFAWELLTKQYGIPADRLVATVFEDDDEAEQLWTKYLPKERIFRFGEKDNFWSMGETGPCGPCSELHYDWEPGTPPTAADVESGRFWEIWNLVFMQFNRNESGELSKLSKPSIDTGMGLERIAAVLQGKRSNYETDLFQPLLSCIAEIAGKPYGGQNEDSNTSMRVIADHIRSTCFLIAEGVLPSNEGRGYVLRRIMRRAIRHGKMLGINGPFFHAVAPTLIKEMGAAYPELVKEKTLIEKVILAEEKRFFDTLENGLKILEDSMAKVKDSGKQIIPGEVAFKLYDTYGFPMDLTEDIARENNCTVDKVGFEQKMQKQREQARAAQSESTKKVAPVYTQIFQKGVRTEFVGYELANSDAKVAALIVNGSSVHEASTGDEVEIVLESTPFYAEGGGQVGDKGTILNDECNVDINDTQKPFADLFVHYGKINKGKIKVGDKVVAIVDEERHNQIRKHHTATHLLHAALRSVLGEHVRQAGSLVTDERLRFDFSHYASVTSEQMIEIESQVNEAIQKNVAVTSEECAKEKALASGAMAFFGDKYGEKVRVVNVPGISMELCGGIHVSATGSIGLVQIVGESSVAAGVRRIEAVVGRAALQRMNYLRSQLLEVGNILQSTEAEITDKAAKLMQQVKQSQKELKNSKIANARGEDFSSLVQDVNGVKVVLQIVEEIDANGLRELGDQYRQKISSGVVVLGASSDGKASVIVMVSKDLSNKFNAGTLIKPVLEELGGRGGGRPDMAQGGGPNVNALQSALAKIVPAIKAITV